MGIVVNATPRPLYPREITDNHCIGGWVGPRAGLNVCGQSRPPPTVDPRNCDIPVRLSEFLPMHVPYFDLALNCNRPERTATKALLDSEPKPEPGCWTSA